MKAMGIIFANDGTIGPLTEKRTMASLPFGGRYRHVDFALSNLSAAGIRHMGIITRHNYQSLMNHIGSGEEWGLELEEGGLEYLTPYATSRTDHYRGKLESLYAAMSFLECGQEDEHVIMIDSAVLSNIDLNDVLNAHIASGKPLTMVTKTGIANGVKQLDLAVKLDDQGGITDMAVDYVAPADYAASMDIFVLSKKWLIQQVREHIAHAMYHMDRDLVLGLFHANPENVNVYPFQGLALFNESVEEYYQNSLALNRKSVRDDLFNGNHPIFTKVRDRVPAYYGDSCNINTCTVTDGCVLEGTATNSVLFRQVTLEADAEIEDCVIMNDCVIGAGSQLKCVILDKDILVRPGSRLIGTPTNPIMIKRGDIV